MDTLQASHVVIFEMVIIYIVMTFAIVFNISFGTDDSDYSDYGQSLYVPVISAWRPYWRFCGNTVAA
jgi:hypothetical protein